MVDVVGSGSGLRSIVVRMVVVVCFNICILAWNAS